MAQHGNVVAPVLPVTHPQQANDLTISCCYKVPNLRSAIYIGPLATAFTEASDTAMGLYQADERSNFIITSAALIAYFSSFGLTYKTTQENMDESFRIVNSREIPHDWPPLSKGKERIAIGMSLLIGMWGGFAESIQAYFFVREIPREYLHKSNPVFAITWQGFSMFIAGATSLTKLSTDNFEAYKIIRKTFSCEPSIYTTPESKFISPLLGGSLGALKAIQDGVQDYIAIKFIFDIKSHGLGPLAACCSIDAFTNFCFAGMVGINALDEFVGYLKTQEKNAKDITAFLITFALSLYLAYWQRSLNLSFYEDIKDDFGIDSMSDSIFEGLSWAMLGQQTLLSTASMFTIIKNGIYGIASMFSTEAKANRPAAANQHANMKQPLLNHQHAQPNYQSTVYKNSNPNLLFTHSQNKLPAAQPPINQHKKRCIVM